MKKLIIPTLVLALSAFGANAQESNDPTYSSHNYKHPNKAEKMKKIEQSKPVLYLEEVELKDNYYQNSLTASANYKAMQPDESKFKMFVVTDNPAVAPFFVSHPGAGHYKQQFAPRPKTDHPVQVQKTLDVVASK